MPEEPRTLGPAAMLLILLFGGSLLGLFLGRHASVLTYHEALFAEPAREMIATGDWLIPRFVGQPIWDKPPLTHWLIAATMAANGSDAEWVARVPSVLAALATALIVAALAARWFGRRVGLLAGLVQCSSYYVLMQGRLAESDMLLTLWVTGAFACLAVARVQPPDRHPRWPAWLFFACVGLAFMTKYLAGPALIFVGVAAWVLVQRDWRAWRLLLSPVGWAILIVLIGAWPAAAYLSHPDVVKEWYYYNIEIFTGAARGRPNPLLFYFYATPLMMLPWSPWLAAAAWVGVRQRRFSTPHWRMIWLWVGAGLLLLTAGAWKWKHYMIPIMPPLSILVGWFLVRDSFERPARRPPALVSSIALAAGYVTAVALLWQSHPRVGPEIAVVLAVSGLLLIATAWADHMRRPVATLALLLGAFWSAGVAAHGLISPALDVPYRDMARFGERADRLVPPGETIHLVALHKNQLAYYLRSPRQRTDRVDAFGRRVRKPKGGTLYVVAPEGTADALADLGRWTRLDRSASPSAYVGVGRVVLWKLQPGEGSR
jgi:4-amino-4-deoxy-L-arabinose transferase-like glycosyltransferase